MIFVNLIYRHFDIFMFQNVPAKRIAGFRAVYQSYSNSNCQYPRVSGGVCRHLLLSVDIVGSLEMSGGVWGMSGRCLGISE